MSDNPLGHFVLGLVFDPEHKTVLLTPKRSGRLGPICGARQPGESPLQAMGRSFDKLIGLPLDEPWEHFLFLSGPGYSFWVYRSTSSQLTAEGLRKNQPANGLPTLIVPSHLPPDAGVSSLYWMIPLAIDPSIDCPTVVLRKEPQEAILGGGAA